MNNRAEVLPTRYAAVILLALIGAAGCQFVPEPTLEKMKLFGGEKPPQVPDRMMAIWTDTVLHQPQQPGVRGFGGRVYFYRGEKPDPIVVDGGLVVYAFDGDDVSASANKPEKKYVLTADQFAEHMSYTDLGPSYSVWLPWDEIGGPNRQLSLIARFEGRNGGVVLSKPMVKLLPGVGKYIKDAAAGSPSEVIQAAGQQPQSGASANSQIAQAGHLEATSVPAGEGSRLPSSSRRPSLTIDLPPNFRRHLKGPLDADASRSNASTAGRETGTSDRDRAEPTENSRGADQATGKNEAAAAQGDSTPHAGESSGGTNRSQHPPSRISAGRFNFQERWQRHAFRTKPDASSNDAVRRPAGWMEPLQLTPR